MRPMPENLGTLSFDQLQALVKERLDYINGVQSQLKDARFEVSTLYVEIDRIMHGERLANPETAQDWHTPPETIEAAQAAMADLDAHMNQPMTAMDWTEIGRADLANPDELAEAEFPSFGPPIGPGDMLGTCAECPNEVPRGTMFCPEHTPEPKPLVQVFEESGLFDDAPTHGDLSDSKGSADPEQVAAVEPEYRRSVPHPKTVDEILPPGEPAGPDSFGGSEYH